VPEVDVTRKILFVDDSRVVTRLAEVWLRRASYDVVTAASGHEALEKATAERPDLILMDFNLPDWSGCDTLDLLALDDRTRDIPVVIVSTPCQLAELGGRIDRLVKPFDATELVGKVRQYLPASRTAA
jgi:CheY-like chemotaxis protein